MTDWLTWKAAKGVATAVASYVWKRASPVVRRWRAERQAVEEGTPPTDPIDAAIDEAFERLIGEARDEGLLAEARVRAGHAVVAVGIFRGQAVREWLRLHAVQADLRRSARDRILNPAAERTAPRTSTLAAYERATGEHRPSAKAAFLQTVDVLVASIRASIDPNSTIFAAASAHNADRVIERIDDLEQRSLLPPMTCAPMSLHS
jgi:hypothetical protein